MSDSHGIGPSRTSRCAALGSIGCRNYDFVTGVRRRTLRAAALAIATACLLAQLGCESESDHEDDHDHVGHVIPAHKPKDFPEAVHALRALSEQIRGKVAEGKAETLVSDQTLPHALDIAAWLPEIAADSDMPKKPWDKVSLDSGRLVPVYEAILAGAKSGDVPASARASLDDAGRTIVELEQIVADADPRWFGGSLNNQADRGH
jgi:hypothetical protein